MTAVDLAEAEAMDAVIPIDHTEKMLGLIAHLLLQHMGVQDVDSSICMPWVDNSPAAQQGRLI